MADRVGEQLGNYRLIQLLGQGNFAEVYLGEHLHLNTRAAIKVLRAHFSNQDGERFRTEARTIARLVHPHIVRILDFDVEEGLPFLVMDYAAGGSMRQRYPKGTRLPLDTVVSSVKEVASALQYAHDQQLIHRDIKPENMLLGRTHEILLSDFGLALLAQSSHSKPGQETAGTIAYMAPEQLQTHASPASDQYALGVVVYEWLSGDRPFHGSFPELALKQTLVSPPSLCEQVPTLPPAVEQVVLKALAKDPQQRFPSVRDFALALEEGSREDASGQTLPLLTSAYSTEAGRKDTSLRHLQTGTLTLLFTDIDGSMQLLQQLGERYTQVLGECRRLLRHAFQQYGGHEVDTQGDAFFVAFARATDAVSAAVAAQRALARHGWKEGMTLHVRMGLHTGEPVLTPEGYVGLDVHHAARIMSAAYGGQILLSPTTRELVEHELPAGVSLRDLGERRLKDLQRPTHLFQVVIADLPADFPRLKTLDTQPNNLPVQPTPFIGRAQEVAAVAALLCRKDIRLVTLTGPGGTGKTRLSLQVAAELSELFPDGVFFVNLAPLSDPAFVLAAIAQALYVKELAEHSVLDLLKAFLREKHLLLLLDNFEQVVRAAQPVAELLAACPKLKIVVTSRMTLQSYEQGIEALVHALHQQQDKVSLPASSVESTPSQPEQPPAQDEASSIDLLERDRYVEQLSELFHTATSGHGRTVLVSGEAGIGKTALVEQFVSQQCRGARRLWGACEALFTPRPLGPLYDLAAQTRGTLAMLMSRDTPRPLVFSALLDELQTSAIPSVVVFEDVHWADEATLDLIKFLGRRIPQLAALFIVTYRDDELSLDHPLRSVFGDLPSKAVARLRLVPLSEQAVTRLAQQAHRSADELYAITGGNPFFVTEVLASDTAGTPMTVRDAVLVRVARFSAAARALLELASVVPTRTERWLLEAILGAAVSALEECLTHGMLTLDQTMVAFRHELARQAVESTLSPLRRQALHTQVLQALLKHGEDPSQAARLVHHAMGAQDGALVLRYAPLAAHQASAQGAHREAAAQYATALRYADQLPPERQAELLEGRAYECYLTSQVEEAVQPRQAALRIWQQLDRPDKGGQTLRWLSELSWVLGKRGEAEQYAAEAVRMLETLPPGAELAMAYSNRAQLAMLAQDNTQAVQWGERAMALAESLGDVETLVDALNNLGTAQLVAQDEQGRAKLERSLRLALEGGWEYHAARAYLNLGSCTVNSRDYARAARYLQEGIAYCTVHDLDTFGLYMRARQAQARFEQGVWEEAAEEAARLLERYRLAPVYKFPALLVLGWVRVRRGDPGSAPLLDEARDLALASGELQRIACVAAARAEAAWLQGKQEQCLAEARVGYDQALVHDASPWTLGELCIWMWRAGGLSSPPGPIAEPFARQIAGDWRGAAALWAEIGCPYEQALALAEGDAAAQRSALSIFERLGALPALALLRQQGRTMIPEQALIARGSVTMPTPVPTTHPSSSPPTKSPPTSPDGLTAREVEVLRLVAQGLSNAEIAEQLIISLLTVKAHMRSLYNKLGISSRSAATRYAIEHHLM